MEAPPWGRRRRDRLPLLLLVALAVLDTGWSVYLFTQPGPPFSSSPAWMFALTLTRGHLSVLAVLLLAPAALLPAQFGRRPHLHPRVAVGLVCGALGWLGLTVTFVNGALLQSGLGAGVAVSAVVACALHVGVLVLERR